MRRLIPLLCIYWILVTWTSLNTPFFEAPDAYYHFSVIQHVARTGELPPKESRPPWEQMTYHAPLYYLTAGALISPFETLDYHLNPHAQIGEPSASHNHNFIAHVPGEDNAVWLIRALSMMCGMVTLIGVYALVRQIVSERAALLAVMVVMFNPQFLFINGVVSNDPLVTALSTVSLAQMVSIYRHGITTRNITVLAVLLALNALAKASGIVLYPVAAFMMAYICWRDHVPLRRVLIYGAIGISAWGIIAGWWYIGNFVQFGDFTGTAQVAQATGARINPPADLDGELRGMVYSFWGLFGWFNIPAPDWFYDFTGILVAAGVFGLLIPKLKRIERPLSMFLLLYVLLFTLSWWHFHQMVNAAQGRLFFPVIGVFALVIGAGLARLPRLLSGGLIGILALMAITFPPLLIAPAYASTPPLETWTPPQDAVAFEIREPWKTESCLTAWTLPPQRGEITVWWEVTCEIEGYWSIFLHVINPRQEFCVTGDTSYILAQFDSMPDGGNRPFPAMQPGSVYEETISIPWVDIRDTQIQVGLYDAGGTFIRAFVTPIGNTAGLRTGKCAPESILYP